MVLHQDSYLKKKKRKCAKSSQGGSSVFAHLLVSRKCRYREKKKSKQLCIALGDVSHNKMQRIICNICTVIKLINLCATGKRMSKGFLAFCYTSELSSGVCLVPVYPLLVWRTVFKTPLSMCASVWWPLTHNDPTFLVSLVDYSRRCAQSHLLQQIPPDLCGLSGCAPSISRHCQPEPLQAGCPSRLLFNSTSFLPSLQNLLSNVSYYIWLKCGLWKCNALYYIASSVSSPASYPIATSTAIK